MINNIKKKSLPLVLLNARITDKSLRKWKIFRLSARNIFEKFDICLSSNLKSKNYLKSLGAKRYLFSK